MEEEKKTQTNPDVQTYAEDMASVIEIGGGQTIKSIIDEEEIRIAEKKKNSKISDANKIFLFAGVLLVLTGLAALVFIFNQKEEKIVQVAAPILPIISLDQKNSIDITGLTREQIIKAFVNQASVSSVAEGEIEGIYLAQDGLDVNFPRFIELIKSTLFSRVTFAEGDFLMGIYNGGLKDTFILIKVEDFGDTWNVMRFWEEKMFQEVHDFFGINLSVANKNLLEKDFEDEIVENKNARVLYDDLGQIALLYVFVDDTHVLLTTSESAVAEVILRLKASRVKK